MINSTINLRRLNLLILFLAFALLNIKQSYGETICEDFLRLDKKNQGDLIITVPIDILLQGKKTIHVPKDIVINYPGTSEAIVAEVVFENHIVEQQYFQYNLSAVNYNFILVGTLEPSASGSSYAFVITKIVTRKSSLSSKIALAEIVKLNSRNESAEEAGSDEDFQISVRLDPNATMETFWYEPSGDEGYYSGPM